MDAKLNHSDLIALFSKACGVPLADAEAFSSQFFELIVEGLESDGIVKVNGLGTFRITSVESRESVNVNTGERFEIKGHKKLSFTPAESLKETINAPFAMFQPVEVDDEIEEETEVMPLDADAENEDVSETSIEPDFPSADLSIDNSDSESANIEANAPSVEFVEEELPASDEQPPVADTHLAETIEEEQPLDNAVGLSSAIADERAAEETQETAVEAIVIQEEQKEDADDGTVGNGSVNETEDGITVGKELQQPDKGNGRGRAKRVAAFSFAAILAALIVVVGYNIFDSDDDASQVVQEKPLNEKLAEPTEAVAVAGNVATDSVVEDTQEEMPPFVLIDTLAKRRLAVITVKDTTDYIINGTIVEHTVELDETLIRISLKHYGDKRLWPYIVQHNNLSQPDELACGMVLKIPSLVPRN